MGGCDNSVTWYYKFEITCQKYRRKILPTPFAALKTVPFGTPYITAWDTKGIPQELSAAKADKRPETYDTLSVDLSNNPHLAEDA